MQTNPNQPTPARESRTFFNGQPDQYRELRAGEIGVVLPDFRYLVSPYARPLVLEARDFMIGSSPLSVSRDRRPKPQRVTMNGNRNVAQVSSRAQSDNLPGYHCKLGLGRCR